jgi:hypothetical protein
MTPSNQCPPELREEIHRRAGGRCECSKVRCSHVARCTGLLRGEWAVHRLQAAGAYVLSNVLGLCQTCHRNAPTCAMSV